MWPEVIAPIGASHYKFRRFIALCLSTLFGLAILKKNSPSRNTIVLVLVAVNDDFLSKLPLPGKTSECLPGIQISRFSCQNQDLIIKNYHGSSEFRWILSRRNISPPRHVCVVAECCRVEEVDGGSGNEFGFDNLPRRE